MRLDMRLHGHLEDGRECSADMAIYLPEDTHEKREQAILEAVKFAPWLLKESGWPDIPEGATVIIDRAEDLNANRKQKQVKMHAKMIAPGVMVGGGPPGSLGAFLEKIGAVPADESDFGAFLQQMMESPEEEK